MKYLMLLDLEYLHYLEFILNLLFDLHINSYFENLKILEWVQFLN